MTLTARETPGHSPGCTSWAFSVKDGDATRSVLIFCSGTVALNRLGADPTYFGSFLITGKLSRGPRT